MTAYTIMNLGLGNGWVLAKHRRHPDGVHGVVLTYNGVETAFGFKTIAELESQVRMIKARSWQKMAKARMKNFHHSIGSVFLGNSE